MERGRWWSSETQERWGGSGGATPCRVHQVLTAPDSIWVISPGAPTDQAGTGASPTALALASGGPDGVPSAMAPVLHLQRRRPTLTERVSAGAVLRLARWFGTSARFWMNLQLRNGLAVAPCERGESIVERPQAARTEGLLGVRWQASIVPPGHCEPAHLIG